MKCKSFLFCFAFLFSHAAVFAQEVVIRNDNAKIKSEIQDTRELHMQYEKWAFQDGPLYNLLRSQIFLMTYTGGYGQPRQPNITISSPIIFKNLKSRLASRQRNSAPIAGSLAGPPRLSKKIASDTVVVYKISI